MKRPVEAIETLRSLRGYPIHKDMADQLLAYLDSLPEWPADLTRERLEELATDINTRGSMDVRSDALRRLAELAPRGKRKVEIWENEDGARTWAPTGVIIAAGGWTKKGEAEIDA